MGTVIEHIAVGMMLIGVIGMFGIVIYCWLWG